MKVEKIIQPEGHTSEVEYLRFTPDGKKLISACRFLTKCWDVKTRKLLWTAKNRTWLFDMDITPDGKTVLQADETLDFINIENGKLTNSITGDFNFIEGVKVSPNLETFAVLLTIEEKRKEREIEFYDYLQLRDLKTKEILWKEKVENGGLLSFSPDGREIIFAEGKTVEIFNAKTGERIRSFSIFENSKCRFASLHISADGKFILSRMVFYHMKNKKILKREVKVVFINLETGKVIKTFDNSVSAAFSPNGEIAALGGFGEITFIDTKTLKEIKTFRSTLCQKRGKFIQNKVFSLAFSPNNKYIAAGGSGIELWNFDENEIVWKVEPAEIIKFVFPYRDFLILITDTKIFVFHMKNKSPKPLAESEGFIRSATFNQKTGILACGTDDKKVLIIDINEQTVIREVTCPTFVNSVTFSNNGKTLAAGCFGTIVIINVDTGGTFEIPVDDFSPSALIYRGNFLLGCFPYKNSEFILENFTNRKIIRNFGRGISTSAFSQDGKFLAVGKINGEILIVDTESGLTKEYLKAESLSVLKFLDRNFLACGTHDGDVILFNLKNNKPVLKFQAHTGFVEFINYLKDENCLISTGADGTLTKCNILKEISAMNLS